MYHIDLNKRDIVKTIIFKFERYLEDYNDMFADKEAIYIKAFNHYLVLSEYGIFPKKAGDALDKLMKIHLGYNSDEVLKLTYKLSEKNLNEIMGNHIMSEPLSEKEMDVVTKYHEVLFGKYTKKHNPFDPLSD